MKATSLVSRMATDGQESASCAGRLVRRVADEKGELVLDGDIRAFFDSLNHEWLVKFIEHRIADQRVVRLIRKWLNAGVLEKGQWTCSEEGTPQGGSASPLLANIYLHYVFDLWVQHWRKTKATGDVIVVRWADDFVVGFQHQSDAVRFHQELAARFANFKLELHPEKTRVIEFGRYAAKERNGGTREAGDIQLSGLHPHLWAAAKGEVHGATAHDEQEETGQAEGGQNGTAQTNARRRG